MWFRADDCGLVAASVVFISDLSEQPALVTQDPHVGFGIHVGKTLKGFQAFEKGLSIDYRFVIEVFLHRPLRISSEMLRPWVWERFRSCS